MISTKINVDTSELLKAFKLLESQGKLTADNIDKAFNNSLKIEVDSSDFKKIETEATTMFGKLKNNLKGSFDMSQILNFSAGGLVTGAVEKGLSSITQGFTEAIEKGSEFQKQLNAVGAITGQSGEALDKIGESALELSKQFGGNVNEQLGAFQGILSKFGSELANTPEALNEVTKNVNLLAKASGMDATQSMNALTDAMLQFGVDTTNANEVSKESARFMNLLAASAKVGAAEIPELTASMLQVGVSAKSAGIGAEEITGALQRLAVGGKKGSEAGIGLRNVLGLLQKQSGEGDKVLEKMGLTTLKLGESLGKNGLAKTLDLVKNGLNNFGSQTEKNQAILQLFGAENSTVAGLLLENTKQITEFTKASTGTASGVEQATTNMQGFSESMSRLKSNIDAVLIAGFLQIEPILTGVTSGLSFVFENILAGFTLLGQGFDILYNNIANSPFAQLIITSINDVSNTINTLFTNLIKSSIDLYNSFIKSNTFQFLSDNIAYLIPILTILSSKLIYNAIQTGIATTQLAYYATAQALATAKTVAFTIAENAKNYAIGIANNVIKVAQVVMTALSNGTVIATAKTYLFATAQTLLNAIMSANPIGLVVVALGALTAGLVYAYKNSEAFRKIIDGIWETMKGWLKSLGMIVTKVLEFFGILGKDVKVKATKEIEKDTKAIETNVTNTNVELDKQSTKVEKNVKAVKTLQQQYDELYKKTLEIAGNSKFKLQYDANIVKLNELKEKIEGNNTLKMKVDFDLQGGITWDDRNKLINDYLKNDVEVSEVKIRPKELTFALKNISVPSIPITSVEVADEFYDNLEKDIAKNFQNVTANINFKTDKSKMKGLLDELNKNTQSELDNLSNSLMSANISYEEYSEQKADILRNAKEQELQIEREHQSNLMTLVNETTAQFLASFKNRYDMNLSQLADYESKGIELTKNTTKAKEELDNASLQYSLNQNDANKKILEDKQIAYNTLNNELIANTEKATMSMSDIYTNMAISMGASLGEAIIQGKNAFDTIVGLAFDFLDKLVPIWSAQILGYALATPDAILSLGATALAKWTALTLIMKAAVAGARNIAGYKDGAININGAGTSTSDSIPAMLSKGESVINARSTAQNEPYLRYINNGGDMSKLVNMNMNTKNIENLLYTNNELLRSKNFNPSINNVNKFNVSSSSIKVVRGR